MILHTVNKSPYNNTAFQQCIALCLPKSAILFIEDGVLTACRETKFSAMIEARPDINFYALSADVLARGLSHNMCDAVTVIEDDEFVSLVCNHHSVQSWF